MGPSLAEGEEVKGAMPRARPVGMAKILTT